MRLVKKYLKFVEGLTNIKNEELRESLSYETENVQIVLNEIVEEILSQINYDFKSHIVSYDKSFNMSDYINKAKDKIGEEEFNHFNIGTFFLKVKQIMELKRRNTKSLIREEVMSFIASLSNRIEKEENTREEDFIDKAEGEKSILSRDKYESEKYNIQVELKKLEEWVKETGQKVVIVFEGRDAAGKGSTIKRFTEYLNPKNFRVVALGIPTEEEKNNWLQRYEKYLPKEGEIVFFDRSWYNRAVVEPALGYCTEEQYKDFMEKVLPWEENLIKDGTILIKFWFSITKEKQQFRFKMRQDSPLKYWKFSPNDAKVIDKYEIIGEYKNQMFNKTSSSKSPWVSVVSNDKRVGRLNSMRYVLDVIDYPNKNEDICRWYPEVINIIR